MADRDQEKSVLRFHFSLLFIGAAFVYFLATVVIGLVVSLRSALGWSWSIPVAVHAHLGTLGWVTLTIMGAMARYVTILSGQALSWQRLIPLNFWLMNLGILSLAGGAWISLPSLMVVGGITVAVAALLFSVNILITIARGRVPTPLPLKFFRAAVVYLGISVGLGVALSGSEYLPWLPPRGIYLAHVHAAMLGWMGLTIMGATYHLVPVMLVRRLNSPSRAWRQFWVFAVGLSGVLVGFLFGSPIILKVFAAVALAGVLWFAWILFSTSGFWASVARSPGVRFIVAGVGYVMVGGTLGFLMAAGILPRSTNLISLHSHLNLVGWATATIFGAVSHVLSTVVENEGLLPRAAAARQGERWIEFLLLNAGIILLVFGFSFQTPLAQAAGGIMILLALGFLGASLFGNGLSRLPRLER